MAIKKFGKRDFVKGGLKNRGVLKKDLGVRKDERIPIGLLNKVIKAKAGQTITNPTRVGKRKIKVTAKVERRAILAKNLRPSTRGK